MTGQENRMHKRMGVTIREILQQDFFREAQVICGHEGIDRNVTSVNVMEVPDIVNWIKPHEFLLTTAYSIKDDLLKLNELIPIMKEVGVTGLGIKTKRYVEDLPASVLDTADSLGFPIVRIPIDLSFGEIISQVLTLVVNKQTALLMQIDEFNTRLKAIMLRGGDIGEIAKMIKEVVDAPVAITDNLFKDYTIASDLEHTHDFDRIIGRLLNRRSEKLPHYLEKLETYIEEDRFGEERVKRIMIPIFSHEIMYGDVVIWDLEGRISESVLYMIESAVSLIALNSSKKMSVYDNENKHRIEFIEGLLSEDEGRQLKSLDKAAYFDFDIESAYGVLVASVNETYDEQDVRYGHAKTQKQLGAKLVRIVERLKQQFRGETIYGNWNDQIIFLMKVDPAMEEADRKARMMRLAKDLLVCARMENMHQSISIGLGRVYRDYWNFHRSHREAMKAIHKMEISPEAGRIVHFDDLGLFRILSNDEIRHELRQFVVEVLGPIMAYDREKNTDLLETLRVYHQCGGSLKKVAEEMHTHYNTVIYRIQRIREIGRIDLSDPDTSLNVHIALKMLEVVSLDSVLAIHGEIMTNRSAGS